MRWWWIVLSAWIAGSVPVGVLCGRWLRTNVSRSYAWPETVPTAAPRAPRAATSANVESDRAPVPVSQSR